jgi:hypothetical protein
MAEIKNEFSWSKSRDSVFQTCPRQYYFNYYGYWGGWERNAPERTREIYVLKKLKNRYMWAGGKVHDCIKRTLKNLQRGISVLDLDEIVSIAIDEMRADFRSSRERRYRLNPKTCALFEHEYEIDLSDAQWKAIADNVEICLRNFYTSEVFAKLKALPIQNWLEVEDFSFFHLNGTKIWAVIDCSFRTEDGVTIIDWKTGRGGPPVTSPSSSPAMQCMGWKSGGSGLRISSWLNTIFCLTRARSSLSHRGNLLIPRAILKGV